MNTDIRGVLTGDDSLDRACKDIPASACSHSEVNFRLNLLNGSFSKLAEQVAGPNIVIPWLLQMTGAPFWAMGLALPIKQAFSLLPQLIAAGYIRTLSLRKYVWTGAALLQTLCLLFMIPAGIYLAPLAAALTILGLLALFSTASGTASIAFQDVLGKTIDKGKRGTLLSARALVGGILTIIAGIVIGKPETTESYIIYGLVALGALLWFCSAMAFAAIREQPGATEGGRNAIQEAGAGVHHFKEYKGFREYLYVRAMLLFAEVAVPYYVLFAHERIPSTAGSVGLFITSIGVSHLISSPFWGKLADRTSKTVMMYSGMITFLAAVTALSATLAPNDTFSFALVALAFLMVGLAESGVRLGRKTYLVDATPQAERATFTAFSNSVIGVLALATGVLGFVAQQLGTHAAIIVIGLTGVTGAVMAHSMPEAEEMIKRQQG
jgi:hypothetical protein